MIFLFSTPSKGEPMSGDPTQTIMLLMVVATGLFVLSQVVITVFWLRKGRHHEAS